MGAMGYTPPSPDDQDIVVEQLKEILTDDVDAIAKVVCWEGEGVDHMLRRFLVATQWVPKDAAAQLTDTKEWRVKNNILRMRTCPASEILGDIEEEEVLRAMPMMVKVGLHDLTGRQISVYRVGAADLGKLNTIICMDTFKMYLIWRLERLAMILGERLSRNEPERASIVMDLEGFGMSYFNTQTKNFLSTLTGTTSHYFPEMMGKMIIINAGWLFKGVWAIVSPWLRPHSRAKITVLGRGCDKEMRELYADDAMSQFSECGHISSDFQPRASSAS